MVIETHFSSQYPREDDIVLYEMIYVDICRIVYILSKTVCSHPSLTVFYVCHQIFSID